MSGENTSKGVAVRVEGVMGAWKARGDHPSQYFWAKRARRINLILLYFPSPNIRGQEGCRFRSSISGASARCRWVSQLRKQLPIQSRGQIRPDTSDRTQSDNIWLDRVRCEVAFYPMCYIWLRVVLRPRQTLTAWQTAPVCTGLNKFFHYGTSANWWNLYQISNFGFFLQMSRGTMVICVAI